MPVGWSFRAVNAVTGTPVPVRVNRSARAGEIGVRASSGTEASSVIEITYPASGLYRLNATARTRDPFGARATAQSVFSNVQLTASRAQVATVVLPALEQLARIPPGQLVAASAHVLDRSSAPADRASRNAGAVRMLAHDATRDGRVTLSELVELLRAARAYADG